MTMLRQALAQVRAHDPAAVWPAGAVELLEAHPDDIDPYRDPVPRTEFEADPMRRWYWSDDDAE